MKKIIIIALLMLTLTSCTAWDRRYIWSLQDNWCTIYSSVCDYDFCNDNKPKYYVICENKITTWWSEIQWKQIINKEVETLIK